MNLKMFRPLSTAFMVFFICCDANAQTRPITLKTPSSETSAMGSAAKSFEKMGSEILVDRPWMSELYSWGESRDLEKQEFKLNEAGSYCVGNGRTFALLGLSTPLWSWADIYGDSYQEPELGALKMNITRAGIDPWLHQQKIGWVKRSGVVMVRAEAKGLRVETYDFAPVTSQGDSWDNPAILVRLIHIVNTGDHSEGDLDVELKVQPAWNVKPREYIDGKDLVLDQKAQRAKKRTLWRLGSFGTRGLRVWDNGLHYAVPKLKPGNDTWAAFFLASGRSGAQALATVQEARKTGALALLDQTRHYYEDWYTKGTEFSGDPRLVDLFEIESMIFKCQQSHTGGFSPLIGYSYTWIRDNNGPIRWFLKTGHPVEAKKAMDFFYGVGSSMGSLPNSIRVDYPLDYHVKDLSTLHVEHAETPNWIVLQHWWYYLTTGDIDFIRSRWTYLDRCVMGQVNVEDKYFFHRDETYLWCLESRCFEQVTFPNYYLSTYAFATDSSFDLVSAADHLAYMGKYLEMDREVARLKGLADRVRAKAESTYWDEKAGYWVPAQSLLGPLYNAPFANILMNPLWCGYARNDLDPLGATPDTTIRAIQALKSAYPILGRKDGFWKTTPTVEFFVGMNPGQLLHDLCKARMPWAEQAYAAVFRTALPSGEFAEMYDGHYHPWNPPIWGVGASGRVRPWEGGLNTESVLEYLTGFSPDAGNHKVVFAPHMPEDKTQFNADRLWVGPSRVSLQMHRNGPKEWNCLVRLEKGPALDITMDFWASRRLLSGVEAAAKVDWDKLAKETSGRDARCHLTLDEGKEVGFTVTEEDLVPSSELEPPKPQDFHPEPYTTAKADLLLVTSPTGIFHVHKKTKPENFPSVAQSELKTVKKVAATVSFLDIDLPVAPADIAAGLLEGNGDLKVKVAVFGRGAFSSGKHHFKPDSYWNDKGLARSVKRFLESGGCLFLGPSYPNRESLPDWLVSLTHGGWEEGTLADKAVIPGAAKMAQDQKLLDELDVDNEGSEKDHAVTFEGVTFEDSQKLPDGENSKKMVEDNGRGISGYYQFTMNMEPGLQHRVWIRMNTGRNMKGMTLAVQVDGKWVQLGIRTQNDGVTRHFESLYFEVPAKDVTAKRMTFRLLSKAADEFSVYRIWSYKVENPQSTSLAETLGFAPNQEIGSVNHGLIPKSKDWKVCLVLSQHPDQAAMMMLKIGNGYLVRSELALEDSVKMLKMLADGTGVEKLNLVW